MQAKTDQTLFRINAAELADATRSLGSPSGVSVLLRVKARMPACEILAIGTPEDIDGFCRRSYPARSGPGRLRSLERPQSVLIPGLVNAHTHLDLTHIGPRPHDPADGFVSWLKMILRERLRDDAGIRDSVRLGVRYLRASGTAAVGDIAGVQRSAPIEALVGNGLLGVSYLEYFGIGNALDPSLDDHWDAVLETFSRARRSEDGQIRAGLQPHAPNTCAHALYQLTAAYARTHDVPVCTHLAETVDEREFIARAAGPQRALLETLGFWNDNARAGIGLGKHPVEHLREVLTPDATDTNAGRWTVAHVNDAPESAIRILAETSASVVYCPRASSYFAAHLRLGPHRYNDMLEAGINVALGTDSIVNQPASENDAHKLSVLDEARYLHRRDGTDPRVLLGMATVNGARALGLDPSWFTLSPGPIAGLVAVPVGREETDPCRAVMGGSGAPEFLFDANGYSAAG